MAYFLRLLVLVICFQLSGQVYGSNLYLFQKHTHQAVVGLKSRPGPDYRELAARLREILSDSGKVKQIWEKLRQRHPLFRTSGAELTMDIEIEGRSESLVIRAGAQAHSVKISQNRKLLIDDRVTLSFDEGPTQEEIDRLIEYVSHYRYKAVFERFLDIIVPSAYAGGFLLIVVLLVIVALVAAMGKGGDCRGKADEFEAKVNEEQSRCQSDMAELLATGKVKQHSVYSQMKQIADSGLHYFLMLSGDTCQSKLDEKFDCMGWKEEEALCQKLQEIEKCYVSYEEQSKAVISHSTGDKSTSSNNHKTKVQKSGAGR